jgi:hypothetical protein
MQQTVVPHLGHLPFAMFVPLDVFVSFGSFISTFCLHLTQYPCTIFPPFISFLLFSKFNYHFWLLNLPIEDLILEMSEIKNF